MSSKRLLVLAINPGAPDDGAVQLGVLALAVELVSPEVSLVLLAVGESVVAKTVLFVVFPLSVVSPAARIEKDPLALSDVVDEEADVKLAIGVGHYSGAISLARPETDLALIGRSVRLISRLHFVWRELSWPIISL